MECSQTRGDHEPGTKLIDDSIHESTVTPDSVPNRLRVTFFSNDPSTIALARSYDCSSTRDVRGSVNWDVWAG